MTLLKCLDIGKVWPSSRGLSVEALRKVSLSVEEGQFVAIVGPSGCGKSTLLEIIAGLETATRGEVRINNATVNDPSPDRCMVFQEHSLFPWSSVWDNVAYGPRRRGVPRAELEPRVREVIERVGLTPFAQHFPHQLSGGMKQRVAIARALINSGRVLLMDEPFAALDFQTRLLMQQFLLEVWESFGTTILFVTHHIDEAILLADSIYMMSASPGRVIDHVTIDLPRPRSYTAPAFNDYRVRLTKLMELEVMHAYAQPGHAAE